MRTVLRSAYAASVEVLEQTTLADVAHNSEELNKRSAVALRYSI